MRLASPGSQAGRELASERTYGSTQLFELLAVGAEEVDAVGANSYGVLCHHVAAAKLSGPAPGLAGNHRAEPVDVLTDLVALEPLGEVTALALPLTGTAATALATLSQRLHQQCLGAETLEGLVGGPTARRP